MNKQNENLELCFSHVLKKCNLADLEIDNLKYRIREGLLWENHIYNVM